MKTPSALSLALLLTACGGGSGGDLPSRGIPPAPGPVVNDAFFTSVMRQMGVPPDEADAATVDGVALTAPDDTEPGTVN